PAGTIRSVEAADQRELSPGPLESRDRPTDPGRTGRLGPLKVIFLDASAIIYLLEGESAVWQVARDTIMRLSRQNADPPVAISARSLLECRVHPIRNRDQERLERFDSFFEDPGLIVVDLARNVVERATLLRAETGMRTPDALQA